MTCRADKPSPIFYTPPNEESPRGKKRFSDDFQPEGTRSRCEGNIETVQELRRQFQEARHDASYWHNRAVLAESAATAMQAPLNRRVEEAQQRTLHWQEQFADILAQQLKMQAALRLVIQDNNYLEQQLAAASATHQ